ncbi:MAG: GGDEF domain-containing protein [Betaproteobacteria bacterium]
MAQLDPKQSVRVRVFAMAAGSYLIGYLVLVLSYFLGMVDSYTLIYLALPFVIPNVTFYLLFRTGLNLNFNDPSLTVEQILVATVVIMCTVYLADQVRALILLFYLILFVFGLLRLNTRQLLGIGCYALITYAGVIVLVVHVKPERVNLRMEILQGLVLGLGLIWFALVGGYISKLRDKLRQSLKTIQEMASHDELTGVFNRRHLNELLEMERSRSIRSGEEFSVGILDIDHFKQVNDTLGHFQGDVVLKQFALEAKNSLRTIDQFGRYGGEEFLVVLPRTNIDGANLCAERIRRLTERMVFPTFREGFAITVSIGIAQYRQSEDLKETLLRADAALYQAKREGRNRVHGGSGVPVWP